MAQEHHILGLRDTSYDSLPDGDEMNVHEVRCTFLNGDIQVGDVVSIHSPYPGNEHRQYRVTRTFPEDIAMKVDLAEGNIEKTLKIGTEWQEELQRRINAAILNKSINGTIDKLQRRQSGKEPLYPNLKEESMLKNRYTQQEYVTQVVARFGLNPAQADVLSELIHRPEWTERFCLELMAANMVAADGEGLDVSLEAMGYLKKDIV